VARCILQSLALSYRRNLDLLEKLTGRKLTKLHIVGGGSQSRLLNQLAAEATGRVVLAGPTEATAMGNLLIQAMVAGRLLTIGELRECVRRSAKVEEFRAGESEVELAKWDEARSRFALLPPL
jgi:rhamnulokinase